MKRIEISKWTIVVVLVVAAGILLSCSFITNLVSSGPEVYWPISSEDGYGLMDCNGEWIIEPMGRQYNILKMVDGVAPIMDYMSDDYPAGIIDSEGNFVVENKFELAWPYSDGFALVEIDEEFRFIDQNGDYAFSNKFPFTYQTLPQFGNGMANVADEYTDSGNGLIRIDSMIYIDKNGDQVLGPYRFAQPFSDGYAAVSMGSGEDFKAGFIDTDGEFVLEFNRDDRLGAAGMYSEGLFPVRDLQMQLEENQCSIGFMNKNGDWVIDPQFCVVGRFVDGLAPAAVDMIDNFYYFGYINTDGDWVIPPDYDMSAPNEFSNGCTLVYWDMFRNMALIDTEGEIIYSYEH